MAGESILGAFKEEVLYFAFYYDSIAVSRQTPFNGGGGAEVFYRFDPEDPPILPGDCPWLHVACGIEIGGDLNVYTFRMQRLCVCHGSQLLSEWARI